MVDDTPAKDDIINIDVTSDDGGWITSDDGTPAKDDIVDIEVTPDDDATTSEDLLTPLKSDSGITRHQKTNSECLVVLSRSNNSTTFFNILAQGCNNNCLAVLEAIFTASYQPALCSQDHVRCLTLL